jgi:hypothetical protein
MGVDKKKNDVVAVALLDLFHATQGNDGMVFLCGSCIARPKLDTV